MSSMIKILLTGTAALALAGLIAINPFSAQRPNVEASHSETTTLGPSSGPASLLAPAGEQLLQAIKKTSKFSDIHEALDSGYKNINVFVAGQGCHYLNSNLLDGKFDPNRPEILVYDESPGRDPVLVAVEYAVPISASPNAPEGFTGPYDVWDENDDFGLWTLHAWTALPNPDGVFAPNNPLAPQATEVCGLHSADH